MPITKPKTRRPRRTASARHRGVVMVITVAAMLLMAALVFYVINLGSAVDRRAAQSHADAAAVAAAGFTARSLNTVAMNNVAMARLVALSATLDSMPLATLFTYKEEMDNLTQTNSQGLSQSLQDQLSRGVTDWWVGAKLQDMLTHIGQTAAAQQPGITQELRTLIFLLDGFNDLAGDSTDAQILGGINWNDPNALNTTTGDNTYMTFYNFAGTDAAYSQRMNGMSHAAGQGQIWKAATSLDQINQATMSSLNDLAYVNAMQSAQVNLAAEKDNSGVTVPDVGVVPWKRGTFNDFQRPVMQGLVPNNPINPIVGDEKTVNRGPYDTLFGWRYHMGGSWHRDGHPNDTSIVPGGGHGSVPIAGSTDGDWIATGPAQWNPGSNYGVYGPYEWMMRNMYALRRSTMPYSRFDYWMRTISAIKLGYLWPGNPPQSIIDPKWIDKFPDAVAVAQNNPASIVETSFIIVEIKSRFPLDQQPPTSAVPPNGQAPTWAYVTRGRPSVPWVRRMPGWVDPRTWAAPQVDNYIWKDQWVEMVYFDRDIGIEPQFDPATNAMIPQKVYRTDEFMFGGINVGTPVFIRNPFNFDRTDASAPAPTDIDRNVLPPTNDGNRWQDLNTLAVTRFNDAPAFWPGKFLGDKAYPYSTAIAQAEVFNDHSWDLWTQMWHSQLSRVTYFDNWADRFANPNVNADRFPTADIQDQTVKYLQNVQPLAPVMLNH